MHAAYVRPGGVDRVSTTTVMCQPDRLRAPKSTEGGTGTSTTTTTTKRAWVLQATRAFSRECTEKNLLCDHEWRRNHSDLCTASCSWFCSLTPSKCLKMFSCLRFRICPWVSWTTSTSGSQSSRSGSTRLMTCSRPTGSGAPELSTSALSPPRTPSTTASGARAQTALNLFHYRPIALNLPAKFKRPIRPKWRKRIAIEK